jgi:hypothetical protein
MMKMKNMLELIIIKMYRNLMIRIWMMKIIWEMKMLILKNKFNNMRKIKLLRLIILVLIVLFRA